MANNSNYFKCIYMKKFMIYTVQQIVVSCNRNENEFT